MNKDWLHISSLGRTIDFNLISDIQWNNQSEFDRSSKRFRTVIFLGTSVANEDGMNSYNEMSIFEEEDRKALHAKFPGIPIELMFGEAPIEEKVELTSSTASDSDDIPY